MREMGEVSLKFGLPQESLYMLIHGRFNITEKNKPALDYLIAEIVKRKEKEIVELKNLEL